MTNVDDEGHGPGKSERGHFDPRGFHRHGGAFGTQLGETVLAERFARGELDADEYRERLAELRKLRDDEAGAEQE